MSGHVKLLDFAIVGAQKAATTALWAKLASHPGLCCAPTKELHLFNDDSRDWSDPCHLDLTAHFPRASPDLPWGEATPITMYWPCAIQRLAAHNPAARIIVSLRHPAWRALSHWRMEVARGRETLSFADAVSDAGRARAQPVHRTFSYVERGFYAPQIRRILEHFPRAQVFFCTMDDLSANQTALLRALCAFLGVADPPADDGPRHVVAVDTSDVATDASDQIAALAALYHDDMCATARLTGLELGHWMDGRYHEDDPGRRASRVIPIMAGREMVQ